MSISKLESLPNEILADILEKYINSIDIINAFAFQLNRRFDALIIQSQRLRLNFIKCHKTDFRVCMGLLPAYVDKIEQLALADRYTPGQMHAFLSLYPSFSIFKNVRKLHLRINANAMDARLLTDALCSISTTSLHTLSLDILEANDMFVLNRTMAGIFRMTTLKKLSICYDTLQMNWRELKDISSNIEYLSMHGGICRGSLEYIFQCAPALRYLNVDLYTFNYPNMAQSKSSSSNALPRMSVLHTATFHVQGHNATKLKMLEMCFTCMPSLQCLKLKVEDQIRDLTAYENLIQTTLPSLTSFTLESTTYGLTEKEISSALASTETPFWTTKPQFNLIMKNQIELNNYKLSRDFSNHPHQDRWNGLIDRWNVGPICQSKNISLLNGISKLYLSASNHSFLQNYYLNNVTHLVVTELDSHLIELLISHVNCSAIKHLWIVAMDEDNPLIPSFLSLVTNIQSLRIQCKQLFSKQLDHSREYPSVQLLDISVEQHNFSEKVISMMSKMFPHLEHLIINTEDLQNVPMLQTYLPRLHSLTYSDARLAHSYRSDYDTGMFEYNARMSTNLFFERKESWFTIWLDEAAFQESYWHTRDIIRSTRSRYSYMDDSDDE